MRVGEGKVALPEVTQKAVRPQDSFKNSPMFGQCSQNIKAQIYKGIAAFEC
jgi:hypothetical protein